MSQDTPIIIIGGNSLVGTYLMQRLQERGLVAEVISRRPMNVPEGFTLTRMDLTQARNWIAPENSTVLSLLPLWVLAQFLPRFMGVKAIIATGSTSRFSKALSGDEKERQLAAQLEASELAIQNWATKSHVSWTLLRATLVYDGKTDLNIARMARFIRRWKCLPLAAPAAGLRQPIHADDVAKAVVQCIDNPAAANKAWNIAGGEILTYRAMAERIFAALHLTPRFIMLPSTLLMGAFRLVAATGLMNEQSFGASVFQRMNQDLVFDGEEALRVLDYTPRGFMPEV